MAVIQNSSNSKNNTIAEALKGVKLMKLNLKKQKQLIFQRNS